MQNIDLKYITDNGVSEGKLKELFIDEQDTVKDLAEGSESMERVESAIKAASSLVNGYCLTRYADIFPWAPVPDLVAELTLIVFKYKAYGRRNAVDEDLSDSYSDAKSTLKDISKGLIKLTEDNAPDQDSRASEDSIRFTNKTPEDRVFKNPQGYNL